MSIGPDSGHSLQGRELSPIAQGCAQWFRHLARAVSAARLYKNDNEVVEGMREQVWQQLLEQLKAYGAWRLRITAEHIALEDEVVVRGPKRMGSVEESVGGPEQKLPFRFYGDGIRGITLLPKIQKREFEAFFDALVVVGRGRNTQDDLMTLLWQANLGAIHLEAVPPEQTIFLSSRRPPSDSGRGQRGAAFAWGATGSEIQGSLGMVAGPQGLHRDTFDDWRLPMVHVHSASAYKALLPQVDASRERFNALWETEQKESWTNQASTLFRRLLSLDDTPETRVSLGHAVATWTLGAIQRAEWKEAERSLELLREIDPDLSLNRAALAEGMEKMDAEVVAGMLDEDDPEDHGRFAALMVSLGPPAIGLSCQVMSLCQRARPRAAATTSLCYLCHEDPKMLQRWLDDPRWYVVRNVVLVLGQIGGPAVVDLLRSASLHPEPRVQREVVRSLGSLSRLERTPILIPMLATKDPQLLSAALHMLGRERHPRVVQAIVERVDRKDFDYLPVPIQRAFLNALSDMADENTVPALERILTRNEGYFAQKTLSREIAARVLQRIGTERAMAVLEAGMRSKTEAVRQACITAINEGRRAA